MNSIANSTLESALSLAAEGIAVFPIVYGTKVPSKKSRGLYDATTNPATIKRWFGGTLKWNLAVRTGQASGVWIFDEDDPNSLKALVKQHGRLPVTKQSRSSRGAHHWFKAPLLPIQSVAGRIGPGLDQKGEGGYVVAPPSIHPDGTAYTWLNDAPIVEAPSWLLVLARKPTPPQTPTPKSDAPRGSPGAYGAAALRGEVEILAAMPPNSGRNNQANRAAFCLSQLVAGGELELGQVEAALIDAMTVNGLVAEDGMRQCLATIQSGVRAGMQLPRNRGGRQ